MEAEQIDVVVKTSKCKAVLLGDRGAGSDAAGTNKKAFLGRGIVGVPHLDEPVSRCRDKLLILAGTILVASVEMKGSDFLFVRGLN